MLIPEERGEPLLHSKHPRMLAIGQFVHRIMAAEKKSVRAVLYIVPLPPPKILSELDVGPVRERRELEEVAAASRSSDPCHRDTGL